jgi:hypothetical protein
MFSMLYRMARRLLLPLLVVASGCVVPVSLRQEQPPDNFRPSFVPELCDPPLENPITPITVDTPVIPHIVAEDPNLDDQLTVRVFRVTGTNQPLVQLFGLETPLLPNDAEHPTRRSADLPAVPWCSNFFLGMTITAEIAVVVADKGFADDSSDEPRPGGLTTRAGWTLVCN